MVGIPAFLPIDPGATAGFYFVTAREAAPAPAGSEPRSGSGAQQSAGSLGSAGSGRAPGAAPFEGLQLGAPLGKGGYGVVYRGVYQGKLVAVKVRPGARREQVSCCSLCSTKDSWARRTVRPGSCSQRQGVQGFRRGAHRK